MDEFEDVKVKNGLSHEGVRRSVMTESEIWHKVPRYFTTDDSAICIVYSIPLVEKWISYIANIIQQ